MAARKRVTIPLLAGAALAALGLVGVTSLNAGAFNPQPDPPGRFGVIGVTQSQIIRLNVFSLDTETPTGARPSCSIRLAFRGMDGDEVMFREVDPAPAREPYAFLELDFATVDNPELREAGRVQVLPEGTVIDNRDYCDPVFSVEVIDKASGETEVFVPPDIGD